jgi:hypothetical protein
MDMARREDVRLNEMKSLFDLGQFPLTVCAGAVLNVVLTLIVTRLIRQSTLPISLPEWIVIVLAANLIPVIVLRVFALKPGATFRPVHEMSFVGDQHKFPLWVYVLASLNMAVWVSAAWVIFGQPDDPRKHLPLVFAAVVVTGFPAWIRLLRS